MYEKTARPPRPRRTFTEEIADIDGSILKLLIKRYNLLQKLGALAPHGRLDAKTEQQLRAAWEKNATRVSRDPKVTRQLFSLLQEVHFLPKPDPDDEPRRAFGLTPMRQAVKLFMAGPKACRRVRMYLALAAASGQPLHIGDTLLNDPLTECVKAFNQAGGRLAWQEDGSVIARAGEPLPLPDKVIFAGDDSLNFHLLIGHYLGRPSHAKFTGDSKLKLDDFSTLRHFAPLLGARLTNVIPKNNGLPVRLEASGMLPQEADIPADLPADAVTGLILAAPCWPQPIVLNCASHPQADALLEEALAVLADCRVAFERSDRRLRILPGLTLPAAPELGMDLNLAAALLALPACAGGLVRLTGLWPDCTPGRELVRLLESAGLRVERSENAIQTHAPENATPLRLPACPGLPNRFAPLALALACLPVLHGQEAHLPELPPDFDAAERDAFLHALDIDLEAPRLLPPKTPAQRDMAPWTAPSPAWAMAYALAAFARPRLTLANPGIMTTLYPRFWALYNALPEAPVRSAHNEESTHDEPRRKRVRLPDVYAGAGGTPGEAGD